jgi:iron complex outermembrane receptor protein
LVAIAAPTVQAQQSDTEQATQRVEITGSNIKRSDKESADNVQVISTKEIHESGQTTVADYLRTLSSNLASFTEQDTNSFSPGASAITLRGLNPKYTLVLLNGQRITNYGFAQNLEETFVDLNTIPLNAVDHIDILKDGASSIYGSDAVAGVVNIVLKKSFKGVEVEGQYGAAQGNSAATYQSAITTGFGDLQNDGYSVMFAASVFHRDDLLASQRGLTASQDTSAYPGGSFGWNVANNYEQDSNPGAVLALPTCGNNGYPGQVINAAAYQTGGLTGTTCAFNGAKLSSLIPGTDRANIVVNGQLKINNSITAFGDFFLAAVKTKALMGGAGGLGSTSVAYNGATGAVSPVSNTLPAGNSSNLGGPLANADGTQDIGYSFQSVGNQYYQNNSYTTRLTGGLKGSLTENWDWQAAAGVSQNNVGSTNYNAISVPGLNSVIANNTYNFLNPSLTPAGTAALRTQFEQASLAKLETIEAKASGPLFSLPAGQVQAAFGYAYRHESEDNEPDSKLLAGDILNYGSTLVDGSRSVNAIYGEVEIPVFKSLIANAAIREERYSDFGGNTSPKLSLRYQPFDMLTLRGAYSLGFNAPSLPEISHSSATYFSTVTDPIDPQQRPSETIAGVNVANPNLKAEKSKNLNMGFVLAPTKDLSFAVDFYRISMSNLIAGETTAQNVVDAAANGDPQKYPGAYVVRNPAGVIEYVSVPYANLYSLYTRGEDFDGSYTFHLPNAQKLTTDLNFTVVDHMDVNTSPNSPLQNFAGTDGWYWLSPIAGGGPIPHLKGTLSETWESPSWTVRGTIEYTAGYHEEYCIQYDACTGVGTYNADPSVGAAINAAASQVHSYTSYDLYAEYRGFKNWNLSASITNLFDKQPPWDGGEGGFSTQLYSPIGRFINLRADYKF